MKERLIKMEKIVHTMNRYLWAKLSFAIIGFTLIVGDTIKKEVYIDFYGTTLHPVCYRLLNGTHQIGCTSSRNGNVGVLHHVKGDADFSYIVKEGEHAPYIALLNPELFTKENILKLNVSGRVTGVIVISTGSSLERSIFSNPDISFSPDQACPGKGFGLGDDGTCKEEWNPSPSNDLMFMDINFPIFLMTAENDTDVILQNCTARYNAVNDGRAPRWPLCAAELNSFMIGANSSVTCVRRSRIQNNLSPMLFCDALSGRNVFSPYNVDRKTSQALSKKKYIVIGTRKDSATVFDNIAPGLDGSLTGVMSLLATVYTMKHVMRLELLEYGKFNIIFSIFDGEAFDYVGSSRTVFEMEKGHWPWEQESDPKILEPASVDLSSISHFLELSQLAGKGSSPKVYMHYKGQENITEANSMMQVIEAAARISNIQTERVTSTQSLPPASALRFLLKKPSIPTIVLAGYDNKYSNRFFSSHLDVAPALGVNMTKLYCDDKNETGICRQPSLDDGIEIDLVNHIADVAVMVARAAASLAGIPATSNIDTTLIKFEVKKMLYCFSVTRMCELYQQIFPPKEVKIREITKKDIMENPPLSTYISVKRISPLVEHLFFVMQWYSGFVNKSVTKMNCKQDKNDKLHQMRWFCGDVKMCTNSSIDEENRGMCVVSNAFALEALSPAFVIDDYDLSSNPGRYSTWTESVWAVPSMRIFLLPDPSNELVVLLLGLGFFLVWFAATGVIARSAHILFDVHSPSQLVLDGCTSVPTATDSGSSAVLT